MTVCRYKKVFYWFKICIICFYHSIPTLSADTWARPLHHDDTLADRWMTPYPIYFVPGSARCSSALCLSTFSEATKSHFHGFWSLLVQLKTWRSSIFFSFLRILGAFFVPFEDIGPWQFDPRPIFWPPLASRKPLFRISGCSVQIWHHAFLGGFSPPPFLRYHTFETKYDVC